jgi:MFS family permease
MCENTPFFAARTMTEPLPRAFRQFLVAHTAAALSMGIQIVVLAWLAVGVLALPAPQVGWVQAANLLPGLAVILLAGALADRWHPSYLLVGASSLVTLAHALTAWALLTDTLTFAGLVVYAAVLGTGNAFVQPAREKLLVAVGDGLLQHTLSRAGLFQFSAQGAGVLIATATDAVGASAVIFFQAFLSGLGVLFYNGLRRQSDLSLTQARTVGGSIGDSLANAFQHKVLRQLILLVGFNGFMHMGLFVMLLPWLARNVYGLSAVGYGALQFVFLAGTITAHAVLLKRRKVDFPGQAVLFCLLYAGGIMIAIAMGPKLVGLYILVACWGGVAGSSAGLSRVVLQTVCADEERGRMMSLYQLALFGMAPLGALAAGYGVSQWGHEAVLRFAGWCSVGLFVLFLFSRILWSVKQE